MYILNDWNNPTEYLDSAQYSVMIRLTKQHDDNNRPKY